MTACLGLLAGLAWRVLLQPTRYSADTEVTVGVVSQESTAAVDWNDKAGKWRNLLHSQETRSLLDANLRRAIKTTAVPPPAADPDALARLLAELEMEREYSASFFHGFLASRIGPTISIRRSDIAANLDFQSLAAIVSDLDPPHGYADNWDFSFFRQDDSTPGAIIVRPDADDAYFKVFYHLHSVLNGAKPALSPVAAWRTAVAEVTDRLEREARFAGGGGFGGIAVMELRREIEAIPVLVANGLYHAVQVVEGAAGDELSEEAGLWRRRWEEAGLDVRVNNPVSATVMASMEMPLYPFAFPRDTMFTRTSPHALATLLSFLAAWEERSDSPPQSEPVRKDPPPVADEALRLPREEPVEETLLIREVVDEEALRQREAAIAAIGEILIQARLEYGSAMLRLDGAKNAADRASREAIAGRKRVDRQRERWERLLLENERDQETESPAHAEAVTARNAIAAHLKKLRETCTEEHPFVKAALRELAIAEAAVAALPAPGNRKGNEGNSGRLAQVQQAFAEAEKEFDLAEARLRFQEEQVACLIEEADGLARVIAEREAELDACRAMPVPRTTIAVAQTIVPAAEPEQESVETPVPAQTPAPQPARGALAMPQLLFEDTPSHILLRRRPPSPAAPLWGMLGGLLLGGAWIAFRGIAGSRFYSPAEAERMVGLPVLAVLPAYDPRSLRNAAEGMSGRLVRSHGGRMQFLPAALDKAEPPPAARRGAIIPARSRPALFIPFMGLAFLLLACLLYYRSLSGFAPRQGNFRGEMPLRTFGLQETARTGRDSAVEETP